jgi:hypothetical protein
MVYQYVVIRITIYVFVCIILHIIVINRTKINPDFYVYEQVREYRTYILSFSLVEKRKTLQNSN